MDMRLRRLFDRHVRRRHCVARKPDGIVSVRRRRHAGHLRDHRRPSPGWAVDVQPSAHRGHAICQAAQAGAAGRVRTADAVVGDRDRRDTVRIITANGIVHQLAVTWASVNATDVSTSASSGSAKPESPSAPSGAGWMKVRLDPGRDIWRDDELEQLQSTLAKVTLGARYACEVAQQRLLEEPVEHRVGSETTASRRRFRAARRSGGRPARSSAPACASISRTSSRKDASNSACERRSYQRRCIGASSTIVATSAPAKRGASRRRRRRRDDRVVALHARRPCTGARST